MKTGTALRTVDTRGTIDTAKARLMGISAQGMAMVMQTVTNIYTDPNAAVVREYACNARDSHVEAGQTRPIEVTLPTPLNPQLVVQDWGVGLSEQQMMDVYADYGVSTKRDSNDYVGALGIGSKSAFAVGTLYTVTTVKDREKTICLFSLNDEGNPQVQTLFHGEADEPNGVRVEVGVENVAAVRAGAAKLFACWRPGTVLVDGEEPKSIWASVDEIARDVYLEWERETEDTPTFLVIMGGVPYNVPSQIWSDLDTDIRRFNDQAVPAKARYVLDVPIGGVDIAPNREDLRITPKTRATFGRMLNLISHSMPGFITTKLDEAATMWEASRTYRRLSLSLNYSVDSTQVYWRGRALGAPLARLTDVTRFTSEVVRGSYSYSTGNYRTSRRTRRQVGYEAYITSDFSRVLFVTDVPDDKVNTVRLYVKIFLESPDGKRYDSIVASPHPGGQHGWFSYGVGTDSTVPSMTFTDFHVIGKSLRKAATPSGPRSTITYPSITAGDTATTSRTPDEIEELDPEIVLYAGGTWSLDLGNPVHAKIWAEYDITIVYVTGSRKLEAAQKRIPGMTQSAPGFFAQESRKIIDSMTADDVRILKAYNLKDRVGHAGLKFVREHKAEITNQVVLDTVEEFDRTVTLTQPERDRAALLNRVYDSANLPNPYGTTNTPDLSVEFFRNQLPLVHVALCNSWGAKQALGSEWAVDKALIDYINLTPVTAI